MVINPEFTEKEARLYHELRTLLTICRDYEKNLQDYKQSSWLNRLFNEIPNFHLHLNIREHYWKALEDIVGENKTPCLCARCSESTTKS